MKMLFLNLIAYLSLVTLAHTNTHIEPSNRTSISHLPTEVAAYLQDPIKSAIPNVVDQVTEYGAPDIGYDIAKLISTNKIRPINTSTDGHFVAVMGSIDRTPITNSIHDIDERYYVPSQHDEPQNGHAGDLDSGGTLPGQHKPEFGKHGDNDGDPDKDDKSHYDTDGDGIDEDDDWNEITKDCLKCYDAQPPKWKGISSGSTPEDEHCRTTDPNDSCVCRDKYCKKDWVYDWKSMGITIKKPEDSSKSKGFMKGLQFWHDDDDDILNKRAIAISADDEIIADTTSRTSTVKGSSRKYEIPLYLELQCKQSPQKCKDHASDLRHAMIILEKAQIEAVALGAISQRGDNDPYPHYGESDCLACWRSYKDTIFQFLNGPCVGLCLSNASKCKCSTHHCRPDWIERINANPASIYYPEPATCFHLTPPGPTITTTITASAEISTITAWAPTSTVYKLENVTVTQASCLTSGIWQSNVSSSSPTDAVPNALSGQVLISVAPVESSTTFKTLSLPSFTVGPMSNTYLRRSIAERIPGDGDEEPHFDIQLCHDCYRESAKTWPVSGLVKGGPCNGYCREIYCQCAHHHCRPEWGVEVKMEPPYCTSLHSAERAAASATGDGMPSATMIK